MRDPDTKNWKLYFDIERDGSNTKTIYYSFRWASSAFRFLRDFKQDIQLTNENRLNNLRQEIKRLQARLQLLETRRAACKDPFEDYDECRCVSHYYDYHSGLDGTCYNCHIRSTNNDLSFRKKTLIAYTKSIEPYLSILDGTEKEISEYYLSLYNDCIQNHQTPWSYYQRGLIRFQNGEIEQALDDIRVLIETYENERKIDQLPPMTYFDKGMAESELGLYHEAISSLSTAIQRDPKNKEWYFERAVAYFEEGEFDLGSVLKRFCRSG